MLLTNRKPDFALLVAACTAVVWAVARACLQSVTLDEADSFLQFATPDWPAHFYPSSGNHVLNTILERIFTTVFGLSHLTLRAPALLGGVLYATASYALCVRTANERAIRWPLFVCLVYSPFIMDYMVAARGYGLAMGFLMAAIWAMAESRYATASVCAGISFCANFSFAYMDAALLAVVAVHAWRATSDWRTSVRALIPGAATAFLICGSTVLTFPRGQLYYGAAHLSEMWASMVAATFDELNPFLVHPLLARGLQTLGAALPMAVVAVLIWQTLSIVWTGQRLGLILARAIAIAVLCHWLALRLMRIPLPMARTAIFFVPPAMLLIGMGAALPSRSAVDAWRRLAGIAVLGLCGFYLIGCLRLSHFKEWKFDADVKDVFFVLEDIRRRGGVCEIGTDWRYSSTLNFYREYFHDHSLPEFAWTEPPVPGKSAYALFYPSAEGFIQAQGLQVVYRGKLSDAVVAVAPR